MSNPTTRGGPTDAETLSGKTRVEVTYRDGRKEVVEVQQFNVRRLTRYLEVERTGDLAACAEMFAGKKTGWADNLTNASVFLIIQEGQRVNRDPFEEIMRFNKDQSAWVKELTGEKSPSPDSLPESA